MSRFKVSSRVLEFGVIAAAGCGIAFAISKVFSPSEEEKERVLREKFPDLVRQSEGRRKNMQAFFDTIKNDPNDKEAQAKFDDLLRGGKGQTKNQSENRLISIDPSSVSDPNNMKSHTGKGK